MNSYEIMMRNIRFDNPDRIGLRFNSLGVSDVYRIFVLEPASRRQKPATVKRKERPAAGTTDEWGCLWEAGSEHQGGDMGQVLNQRISDWDDLLDYVAPDPLAPGRFEGLEEALQEAESQNKFVQLNSPQFIFERMHFLRGFTDLLMDLMTDPEPCEQLADIIMNYQIGIIHEAARLGKGRIHCFDTTDDWGTQQNLFISPVIWRSIFKPRYRKLIDEIHNAGMVIRFHTDGKVNEILPDIIEIGADIINIHQPQLIGIQEASSIFKGKVCVEAAIDIQATLPTGDREKIRQEARDLVTHWATPAGGLIGVEYRYLDAIGATRQSLEWALEAFQEFGQFK